MINQHAGYVSLISGEYFICARKGIHETLVFGPYARIEAGAAVVEFGLLNIGSCTGESKEITAVIDVSINDGNEVIVFREIKSEDIARDKVALFYLPFYLDKPATVEFRVVVKGNQELAVRIRRRLTCGRGIVDFPQRAGGVKAYSKFRGLDEAIFCGDGKVPLFWSMPTNEEFFSNFGDALSPIVVAAMSGLDVRPTPADSTEVRLVGVGTVLNWQQQGHVHVWGTGLDPTVDHFMQQTEFYKRPPNLHLKVHAVRGKITRTILLNAGIDCPDIFGDPGWLLPRIIPKSKKITHELGIIPHLSDFETKDPVSKPFGQYNRYDTCNDNSIKIISTNHPRTWEGFVEKVREITSCRRILSSSFHGLIVPLAYDIPSLYFASSGNNGLVNADLNDEGPLVDYRVRDFMLGARYSSLPVYARYKHENTNWHDALDSIDKAWEPMKVETESFVDAFPLKRLGHDDIWSLPFDRYNQLTF